MGTWLSIFSLLIGTCTFLLWTLQRKERAHESHLIETAIELKAKDNELKAKDNELKAKNAEFLRKESQFQGQIKQLEKEKELMEAKYLKKLTSAEVKKKNLARYKQKMKALQKKTIAEEAEEIVRKGPFSCRILVKAQNLMKWENQKAVMLVVASVPRKSKK